jgi:hypothetical protein
MTQIISIKVGLIAMCIATVPLSLAQMPRIRTSGSNQIGTTTIRAPVGQSGLSGNSTSAPQLGTNFRSSMTTGPNTNVGAHIGINAGAQTGISNQTGGIAGVAVPGLAGSSGNSTGATQTGANARASTNSTANTNAGAHTAAAPVTTVLTQPITVPTQTNDALSSNLSTSGQSPSPVPSASVSPTPSPIPAQSL